MQTFESVGQSRLLERFFFLESCVRGLAPVNVDEPGQHCSVRFTRSIRRTGGYVLTGNPERILAGDKTATLGLW